MGPHRSGANGTKEPRRRREDLLEEIAQLSAKAIQGTLSTSHRVCGNHTCRCHGVGPKHGPYLYLAYRSGGGKVTRRYVPNSAHEEARAGIQAQERLDERLQELSELNLEALLAGAKVQEETHAAQPAPASDEASERPERRDGCALRDHGEREFAT